MSLMNLHEIMNNMIKRNKWEGSPLDNPFTSPSCSLVQKPPKGPQPQQQPTILPVPKPEYLRPPEQIYTSPNTSPPPSPPAPNPPHTDHTAVHPPFSPKTVDASSPTANAPASNRHLSLVGQGEYGLLPL